MGKHLDFYNKYVKLGDMFTPEQKQNRHSELCSHADLGSINSKLFELFKPTFEEVDLLRLENKSTLWWGSGIDLTGDDFQKQYAFTPLRQTIVLLMAAIKNEL